MKKVFELLKRTFKIALSASILCVLLTESTMKLVLDFIGEFCNENECMIVKHCISPNISC